jgi:folate-binding protein YgfZ
MISPALSQEYLAARQGAALIDTSPGLIVVSGQDRASYLQGLLTNDIAALQAGQGCYAAYLTAQGRMIADLWVHELGDVILLRMLLAVKETVLSKLDQFIFSEDVQLGDATGSFACVSIVGPRAAAVVAQALGVETNTVPPDGDGRNARIGFGGEPAIVVRPASSGVSGIDLLVPEAQRDSLLSALRDAGAQAIGPSTAEALRVEDGVPLFGVDMDEDTIPLEAGIEARAISFTKGCYVGQEVIIRVLHRGHGRVARKLVGLLFDADQTVDRGAALRVDDKDVGTITSAVISPALGRPIGLGYVKRDFVTPGTRVTTIDGAAGQVVALPFARS